MAATDFLQPTRTTTQRAGASRFLAPKKPDITTTAGIREFAEQKGIDLPEPKKRAGILGGVGKVIDVLRTGEFAVGGLISGEGVREGIRQKISPSSVLFEGKEAETRLGKFGLGALKLGVDIFLDPTTYLTLGAGAAVKVTTIGGARVALSKTGKELLKEMSEEIVQRSGGKITQRVATKEARQAVAELATKEATQTTLERGGLGAIKRALEKTGVKATRENVDIVLKEGAEGLRAKTGLKFFGKEVVAAAMLKKPFQAFDTALRKTGAGRELAEGVEKIGNAFAKTFNRDFGLPEQFKITKQKYIDSFDNTTARIKHDIKTIFSGTTKADREAMAYALEGGKEAIQKLPAHLRPVATRVRQIFEAVAREEEKRGILNTTLEDYVTHIYNNKERAKTLLGEIRKGQPSGLLRFAKERSIPTIAEAERLGLDPIKDIAEILNVRLMASEKSKLTQDFFGKIGREFGVPKTLGATKHIQIPPKVKEILRITKIPISGGKFLKEDIQKLIPQEVLSDRTSLSAVGEAIEILGKKRDELRTAIRSIENNLKITTNKKFVQFLGKQETRSFISSQAKVLRETEGKINEAIETISKLRSKALTEETEGFVKIRTTTPEFRPGREVIKNIRKQNPELIRRILEGGENLVQFSDVGTGIPAAYKTLQIPANIANDIASMGKRFFDDEAANTLLKGYDKALNFFKGSVTVLFPSFHGRNAISNTILNFMDIGVSAFNPKRWKVAVDVMLGKEGKLTTELGEEYSYSQLRKLMKENQVFQDRLARTDVGRLVQKNVLRREGVAGGGRAVGRAIENEGRLINFMRNLERGFTPEDAAARTKQFLFDYDNLSNFEKDVMRRLIPFYTFTRKNLALQMKTLLTDPKRVINQGRALQAIGEAMGTKMTEEEKQFAPAYVQQGLFTLLQRKGDDRTFLIGFDLPFEDAFEKLNAPLKSALSMMTPFLKAPLELGTGRNFFTERNIKDDDSGNFAENLPQPIKNWLEYRSEVVTKKDGTTFTIQKTDPEKKWIFQNVTAMAGVGRAVSGRTLQQLTVFHKALTGESITLEERYDMVSFFTGVRAITRSLEGEKARQEKEEARELQDALERKGEIGRFERAFIPKEKKKEPTGASRFLQ